MKIFQNIGFSLVICYFKTGNENKNHLKLSKMNAINVLYQENEYSFKFKLYKRKNYQLPYNPPPPPGWYEIEIENIDEIEGYFQKFSRSFGSQNTHIHTGKDGKSYVCYYAAQTKGEAKDIARNWVVFTMNYLVRSIEAEGYISEFKTQDDAIESIIKVLGLKILEPVNA